MTIRLILADDHPLVLNALQQLFVTEADFVILECCDNGESVLRSVNEYSPDIVLLDLRMPKLDGIAVLRALKQQKNPVKVVVLTAGVDEDEVLAAIQLGASGVVLKESAPELLIECVRKVHAGGKWLEKDSVLRALDKWVSQEEDLQQTRRILTTREIDLIKRVANGYSNKKIAEQCFISEGTVKVHLHNIFEKLGVKNRVELCLYARERKLM